ncbi:unannotated protein [freshwater metagenome]|uniref:Unannotated protein n=1 Tax=freshwater metagenome TaxID=449393 RepID=A0A6J6SFX3_9ZZZZ
MSCYPAIITAFTVTMLGLLAFDAVTGWLGRRR